MTEFLTVSETEHGLVRLFVLNRPADLPRGEALELAQIADWLGVQALNTADVQQIWTDDLTDLPLDDLLRQGYDIPAAEIAPHRAAIDGTMDLHPTIFVIIRSSAFLSKPLTLKQDGPLHLIATLREPGADVTFETLPNPDPEAVLEDPPQKKKPSDAAMSGRIATVALLLMALLVWLMIWVAG